MTYMNSGRKTISATALQTTLIAECAPDPLGASADLPYQVTVAPYGLPVQVKSNDPRPLTAAFESWGGASPCFREKPVEIRVILAAGDATEPVTHPTFRAQGNLMTIVAGGHNYACCDLHRGFGYAVLTEATVRNEAFLRCNFIEAMAYTMLDVLHLVTIHAACVSHKGRGFLLVGESGAGKSSLAYACARRGWSYVSDDATALYRRGSPTTALGNPRTFRFRPEARRLFPEITGSEMIRNGKPTIEVGADRLLGILGIGECTANVIVFLNRSSTPTTKPWLKVLSPEDARDRLFWQNYPEELNNRNERLQAITELLTNTRQFEFTYCDLDSAIDFMESARL